MDTQYFLQMGSSVLLAHGTGKPVEDAVTEVNIPAAGCYGIFVRTRDWAALWSKGSSPGMFTLTIDGKSLPVTMGGDRCFEWHWQSAGTLDLEAGSHTLSLHDLTGFDGRCDSILLTTAGQAPGNSVEDIFALRRDLCAVKDQSRDGGSFDLIVVGGGITGMCVALAAARLGSKVALVQDRKLLGGNNSSEIRVALGGRINIGPYPRLGYILNEFAPENKGNARPAHIYEDQRKTDIILNEKNITLLTGYMMSEVEKSADDAISAIIITDLETYEKTRLCAPLFCDCTGDATLGFMAGADCHMGRESRDEFGEVSAPEKGDKMTMGSSVMWYSEEEPDPQQFPDIDWGLELDEETVQVVHRGQWYWETGMRLNQIADAERIRDYGIYVAVSNWNYLKNHYSRREDYRNSSLAWLSFVAGKRESRRIMGEFILKEQDIKDFVHYPDASVSISWHIDQHFPCPENERRFPTGAYLSRATLDHVKYYPVPYRCFYSRDIKNLFMAGRNISVTHMALGTVRVMRTTAMIGEVVGMAASVCRKHAALPADVYHKYLDELKALMKEGTGRTDVPYTQIYTLIEEDPGWREDN